MSVGKGLKGHLGGITDQLMAERDPIIIPQSRTRGPAAAGAPVALAQFSVNYQDLEKQVATLEDRKGFAISLPIADLVESPFHIGEIQEGRVEKLKSNLEQNQLNSPVVVRKLADGHYQVIAGRHRIEAYKRLGRTQIEAVIKEYTDEEVIALVFFDNLFAPVSSDYYKYLGFKQMQDQLNLSHDAIAKKTGISKSQVGRLLSFEKLPDAALSIIESNPDQFGAALAMKLGMLTADFPDYVVQAVQLIADGELEQESAPDWVRDNVGRPASASTKADAKRIEIKSGKKRFAWLIVKGKRLSINLSHLGDAADIESEISKLLEDKAAAASKSPDKSGRK